MPSGQNHPLRRAFGKDLPELPAQAPSILHLRLHLAFQNRQETIPAVLEPLDLVLMAIRQGEGNLLACPLVYEANALGRRHCVVREDFLRQGLEVFADVAAKHGTADMVADEAQGGAD